MLINVSLSFHRNIFICAVQKDYRMLCRKKVPILKLFVTLSNVNRFSESEVRWVVSYRFCSKFRTYTFQQCKKFENRLRFDKVTESLKVETQFRRLAMLSVCVHLC